jgi:hypothetical protein
MAARSPLRSFPWVLMSALAVILGTLVFLYLVAKPGARIPAPAGETTGVVEPAANP